MIKVEASSVAKQLQEYAETVRRKLSFVAANFGVQLAGYAISNTPLGDSVKFAKYYNRRTYLPQEEGIARGNWQWSKTPTGSLQLISGKNAGSTALNAIRSESVSYKLGETYSIVNAAPYIGMLENNYSDQTTGNGIVAPTIALMYQIDLKQLFDQG